MIQFNADTDIDPKLKTALEYNRLLKDIPIKSLLEAETIETLATTVRKTFQALKRVRQIGSYPLQRAIELGQCIAHDFDDQLKKVLSSTPLMRIDYMEFQALQKQLNSLQVAWQEAIKDLKSGVGNAIQSGNANRQTMSIHDRINKIADDPLFKRITAVSIFRSEHYKLKQVIDATFQKEDGKSNFREQALRDM